MTSSFPRTPRERDQVPGKSGILLALFCCLNILIYLDRGTISSNGVNSDGIQKDLDPSLFEVGLLPAAFMVGLLVSSPIFATMSKSINPLRLIGYGLSIWAISVFLCGCSLGFWSLVAFRMAVGIGEASFVALASPFIDDTAPREHKALWLGLFYSCIPVGYALGFLYGGTVGMALGWRAAFILESLFMLPLIAFCFKMNAENVLHPIQREVGEIDIDVGCCKAVSTSIQEGLSLFLKHRVFLLTSLGMTCYTGVIGSYAYYGPEAATRIFDVSSKRADIAFSIMTVLTGILGTFSGGYLLDAVGGSIRHGMLLCSIAMCAGACFIMVAFITSSYFQNFCIVFSVGEFLLFATQAPGNALILWSVPHHHRALAMSMSVVFMHILGDVPGPPLMGLLETYLGNWRSTMTLAAIIIALGGMFYGFGISAAKDAIDYRDVPLRVDDQTPSPLVGNHNDADVSRYQNDQHEGNDLEEEKQMLMAS